MLQFSERDGQSSENQPHLSANDEGGRIPRNQRGLGRRALATVALKVLDTDKIAADNLAACAFNNATPTAITGELGIERPIVELIHTMLNSRVLHYGISTLDQDCQ